MAALTPNPSIQRTHSLDVGRAPTKEIMFRSILQFWFHETTPAQWWKVDPEFDRMIAERFGEIHSQAARAELFEWRIEPRGRLAEVIVLDQFSRNIFRGDRRAFEADVLALALAQEAVSANADTALTQDERVFLYMPYMHSESKRIHAVAERLFERTPRRTTTTSSFDIRQSLTDSVATLTATQRLDEIRHRKNWRPWQSRDRASDQVWLDPSTRTSRFHRPIKRRRPRVPCKVTFESLVRSAILLARSLCTAPGLAFAFLAVSRTTEASRSHARRSGSQLSLRVHTQSGPSCVAEPHC